MKTSLLTLTLSSLIFLLSHCNEVPKAETTAPIPEKPNSATFQESLHDFQIDCEELAILMEANKRDREAILSIVKTARTRLSKLAESGHLSSITFHDLSRKAAINQISDTAFKPTDPPSLGIYSRFVMADIITPEDQASAPWNPIFPPTLMAKVLTVLQQTQNLTERDQALISDWQKSHPSPQREIPLSLWNRLSAAAQNTAKEMAMLEGGAPDPSALAETTAPIRETIQELANQGFVEKRTVTYQIDTRQEQPFATMFELKNRFAKRFGPLSTFELIGFGAMTRTVSFPRGQVSNHERIIYLPEAEMAEAVEFLLGASLDEPAPHNAKKQTKEFLPSGE